MLHILNTGIMLFILATALMFNTVDKNKPNKQIPWVTERYLLTEKHLREIAPDGRINVEQRINQQRMFISADGSFLCTVTNGNEGNKEFTLFGESRQTLWHTILPINCGDIFLSRNGSAIILDGFGMIGEYNALGAAFLDPTGKLLKQVRPTGAVTAFTLSKDEKAVLFCWSSSKEDWNHTNILSLYTSDGFRIWETDIGNLRQVGECIVSSNAVFTTTYAPNVQLLRLSRHDGQRIFSKHIEYSNKESFCFFQYLALSNDERILAGIGWESIVALDANTGHTRWHTSLNGVSQHAVPRGPNGIRAYSVVVSDNGSYVAVMAASIGVISSLASNPTECHHYALLYGIDGKLVSAKDLGIITDLHDIRRWHCLILPRFQDDQLYIRDNINELLISVSLPPNDSVHRLSLLNAQDNSNNDKQLGYK